MSLKQIRIKANFISVFMFCIYISVYGFLNVKSTRNSIETKKKYKIISSKIKKKQSKTKYKGYSLSLSDMKAGTSFFSMCVKINLV